MTARQAAIRVLIKVNEYGGYSNLTIDGMLSKSGLNDCDASFAAAIAYGVLERRITLDHCIDAYSKIPSRKLEPEIREILRSGFYQLIYMNVPDPAAANESVNLAKQFKKTSAAPLINAVMRSFIRDGKRMPAVPGGKYNELSVKYSCPEWIVRLWADCYGEDTAIALLEDSLCVAPVFARVNTTRITVGELIERLKIEGAAACADEPGGCVRINRTGALGKLAAFNDGLFHLQDKASQLCALALGAEAGERVLDVCAAPGGKSFTIAQLMDNRGELYAADINEARSALIKEGAERLGLKIIIPLVNDSAVYNDKYNLFDRILCDPPCSGLGAIRRKPEIKYKQGSSIKELTGLQHNILKTSSKYLRAGGTLVYSTCTLNPAENEAIIQGFLKNDPQFEACPLPVALNAEGNYYKTFMPHIDGTDGFFISLIKRRK